MNKIQGVYTALVTPFNEKGELDEQGLRQNLRFQLQGGVDGITVLGTTGEAPTLTLEEQKRIICIAREELNQKIPLMVGTGSSSTAQTIENTLMAKKLGADSALVVTPYFNKPTQEGIYLHFRAVAEEVKIPLILYNTQGRTGQNIQTETLVRLSKIPNIIGVKESSGNIAQISEVLEAFQERTDFCVLSGDDPLTLPLMALGGSGVISVASNLIPDHVKSLVDAISKKELSKARSKHFDLLPLFKAMFLETNPIPIKAAMHLCHMPAGKCRLPLCELAPENLAKWHHLLKVKHHLIKKV